MKTIKSIENIEIAIGCQGRDKSNAYMEHIGKITRRNKNKIA
jgi:hypothetical protein